MEPRISKLKLEEMKIIKDGEVVASFASKLALIKDPQVKSVKEITENLSFI